MGVGLGYYFFEQIFLGIFINLFDWFQNVADFLLIIISAHERWRCRAIGGTLGDAPGELHAFLVLAAYALVLGGLAFYLFHRRDIPGASRS